MPITDPEVIKASEAAFEFYKEMTLDLNGITGCELLKAEKKTISDAETKYKLIFKTEVPEEGEATPLYCSSVINKGAGDTDFELKNIVCDSAKEEVEKDEEEEE